MTRDDPNRGARPAGELPDADEALLVDLLRGELDADAARSVRERIAAEPALAAAHDRLGALFAFEQARGVRRDAEHATRIAARIIDHVKASEARAARAASGRTVRSRRLSWRAAIMTSLAINALALGFIIYTMPDADEGDIARSRSFMTDYSPISDLPWDSPEQRLQRLQMEEPSEFARLLEEGLFDDGEPAVSGGPTVADLDLPDAGGLVHHPRSRAILVKAESFKRRRLAGLGRDSESTLDAVRRGLAYLATRQRPDGHFASEGGRSEVEQTARALLPFLGEGTSSQDRGDASSKRVVRSGIGWLRQNAFASDGAVRTSLDADSVDVALIALSEDYTLSYGRLPAAEAEDRAREIEALTRHIRDRDAAATEHVWAAWALDAAARTGVIEATAKESARFGSWVASASDEASDGTVGGELARGSALRYLERGAAKPRLRSWMDDTTDALIGRLLPNGQAKTSEKVGDTALVLLALQVAYRGF